MQALPIPALALLVLAASTLDAQQVERYTLEGDDIAIYNLAGSLAVEPGSAMTVELTRGGADAAKLRVETGELRGRETLRVIYPAQEIAYAGLERGSSTTLKVREDGTFGDGEDDHRHEHDHDHEGSAGRRVRISREGGLRAHADMKVRVPAGHTVSFRLAVGEVSVTNVNGEILVDSHAAPVTATGSKGRLDVDVGSGPVRVSAAEGELHVDTGSGPVTVTGFRGDELSIDTGSGGVSGSELSARAIQVDTGSGDIELTAVTCPVLTLETGSGSISTEIRGPVRELALETGSGDIAVRAPATLAGEVEIETASGDIETDFPIRVTRHARNHMEGTLGSGTGRVAIETGSGDVRLIKSAN